MIYVQITTGRGPPECAVALHHLSQKILKEGPGAQLVRATVQSSIIGLAGAGAEDYARSFEGTILWVCQSPISGRRRKNWFLGVKMIAMPEPEAIVLRDEDLQWDTTRASGPGGQGVNKSNSAVRLTHLPTGISVVSQDERSQRQNKKIALERLQHALNDRDRVNMALLERMNWMEHNTLERGNPVKTFHGPEFVEVPQDAKPAK
jgi:peptide chain release factor